MAPSSRPGSTPAAPPSPSLESPFTLEVAGLPVALRVLEIEGREELSEVYRFRIHVALPSRDPQAIEAALGGAATLRLIGETGPAALVHGIVGAVDSSVMRDGVVPCFHLELVPRMARLGLRTGYCTFQDLTVREIACAVLDAHGVRSTWRLDRTLARRAFVVQHHETDLDFVRRLLALEGVSFWFEHDEVEPEEGTSRELLCLSDTPALGRPIDGNPTLRYRESSTEGALVTEEGHVRDFRMRLQLAPSEVLLRDYDFTHPRHEARSQTGDERLARRRPGPAGAYTHRMGYLDPKLEDDDARRALEAARRDARTYRGQGQSPRLRPGRRFVLADHPMSYLDGEYAITWVEHRGIAPALADGRPVYENAFGSVTSETRFRPALPPAPRLRGPDTETAVVVGPRGKDVHVDSYGRVKLQFLWDLDGEHDEHSSAWVRVAQPWLGPGHGAQFIPRVGAEVVVVFLDGDPARPLVIGCVGNATQPSAFALPTEARRSGFRTVTSPDGGNYNELSMQDERGQEQIRVHAARDLEEHVRHDRLTLIERDARLVVQGDTTSRVAGRSVATVGGAEHSEVQGERRTSTMRDHVVTVGEALSITSSGPLSLGTGADRRDDVAGDLHARWLGHADLLVGKDHRLVVQGTSTTHVDGARTEHIGGHDTRRVGTPDQPTSADVYASGSHHLGAGQNLELHADRAIRLRCGASLLELTPTSIRLEAPDIRLFGGEVVSIAKDEGAEIVARDELTLSAKAIHLVAESAHLSLDEAAHLEGKRAVVHGGGAGLALAGGATLAGGKVVIASKGASLVLDAEAKLDGALVKLNCGGEGAGVGGREQDIQRLVDPVPAPRRRLHLRLQSALGEPLESCPFTLIAAGERLDGETDGEGYLTREGARGVQVLESATNARLTAWPTGRRDGTHLDWQLDIAPLPPANTPEGASVRLRNLGYYFEKPTPYLDGPLEDALRRFQRDVGLLPTGTLDPDTVVELLAHHDH